MLASSSPLSSPVLASKAIKLGDNGDGTFECVQSCPLEVQAYTISPTTMTEQFEALCGNTPSSSIMS